METPSSLTVSKSQHKIYEVPRRKARTKGPCWIILGMHRVQPPKTILPSMVNETAEDKKPIMFFYLDLLNK